MEGLLENLFITHTLPQHYSQDIFKVILEVPYQRFQEEQQGIFEWLGRDITARRKYFERFQRNHLALYGWYLLSSRDKIAIEPYLFRPILQRTPSFENSKVSKAIHSNFPHRSTRQEPNPVRKLFSTQRCRERQSSPQQINSHDLYLHTFDACNGEKYIPYDYNRHINSAKEKQHYNAFIRQSHNQKRNTQTEEQPIHILSKYKEWALSKEKTSLISFRSILADKSLNSQRGLQSLLKRQGSHKLVFVNHQRKPVNYYLRSQLRHNA